MQRREFQRRQQRDQRRQDSREQRRRGQESRQAEPDAKPDRRSEQPKRRDRTRRRQTILVRAAWAVGVLALVAVVAWTVGTVAFGERPGESVAGLGNAHIPALDAEHDPYNTAPPTSGPHISSVAAARIYDAPLPDELQVHNLEDGFVLVQYDCPEDCPELAQGLEEIVQTYLDAERRVVMAPYDGIRSLDGGPARIALTAWTQIDTFDSVDEERIRAFIDAYEGTDHHARTGF